MDQATRTSRLPTPRFSFRRRPAISSPIGPVQHNIFPMSSEDESITAFPVSVDPNVSDPSVIISRGSSSVLEANAKMPPPSDAEQKDLAPRPVTPVIKEHEESTSHWQLPKSRTLHVFSGISNSFSRSTLIPSLRVSNSSNTSLSSDYAAATLIQDTVITTDLKAPAATLLPVTRGNRWSLGSHRSQVDLSLSQDPCFIHEAQPSAYWAGRFMSLHDKFQSESLTPRNMQSLILAHSHRTTTSSQQRKLSRQQSHLQDVRYNRYPTGLPPSVTSSAILQQTGGDMPNVIAQADVAMLLDDDERCRRVFVHLEAFCATDEARRSLRLWQRDYATKTGRKKLLPKGAMKEERHGGSYISRLMGGKRMGKRASVM